MEWCQLGSAHDLMQQRDAAFEEAQTPWNPNPYPYSYPYPYPYPYPYRYAYPYAYPYP